MYLCWSSPSEVKSADKSCDFFVFRVIFSGYDKAMKFLSLVDNMYVDFTH